MFPAMGDSEKLEENISLATCLVEEGRRIVEHQRKARLAVNLEGFAELDKAVNASVKAF